MSFIVGTLFFVLVVGLLDRGVGWPGPSRGAER